MTSFNTRLADKNIQGTGRRGPWETAIPTGPETMTPVATGSTEARQLTICVVAGDPAERQALAQLLGRLEHEIHTFDSAEALLGALAESPMTVLVTGLELPGMSGVELLHELEHRGRRVPAILLAGKSDVATAVEAIRAGAVDFIQKPVIDRILLRRVKDALNRTSL